MGYSLTQDAEEVISAGSFDVKAFVREFLKNAQKDTIVSVSKDGSLIASAQKSENITSSKTQNAVRDLHSLRAEIMKRAKA